VTTNHLVVYVPESTSFASLVFEGRRLEFRAGETVKVVGSAKEITRLARELQFFRGLQIVEQRVVLE